jgi:starch synthase
MEIVHIAAELTPIAKVGGLGDVLLGLCRALSQKGHQVEIILPKYDCLDLTLVKNLEVKIHDLSSFFDGEWHHNTIWQGEVKGIRCTLIEAHDPLGFFERKTIYGCPDDPARFCYFARAAAEYLFKEAREPDIIHLHDWHVSIFPVLLKEVYEPLGFSLPKMVLTIHNLAYQGLCIKEHLDAIGIPGEKYDQPELIQDLWKPDQINLIKAGILFCDAITTVSPEYAKEILTPEKGHGYRGKNF